MEQKNSAQERERQRRLAQKFNFTPQEIAQGANHPIFLDLEPFRPGGEANGYIHHYMHGHKFGIGEKEYKPKPAPEQIYDLAQSFFEGYRCAQMEQRDMKGNFYEPQSLCFLPYSAFPEDVAGAAAYILPGLFVSQKDEDPFDMSDRIVLTERLFLYPLLALHSGELVDAHPDTERLGKLSADEYMYMCGYEEGRHMVQEHHPALRKQIEEETEKLKSTSQYDPSDRKVNPREVEVGARLQDVLNNYRAMRAKGA